eukprot:3652754-Rhodomonas_salina.1
MQARASLVRSIRSLGLIRIDFAACRLKRRRRLVGRYLQYGSSCAPLRRAIRGVSTGRCIGGA